MIKSRVELLGTLDKMPAFPSPHLARADELEKGE
jgi:hypothetical protein